VALPPPLVSANGDWDYVYPLGLGGPKTVMSDPFRAERDFLLVNRTAHDVAYRGFQRPKFERFNWALDWFDSIAAGERSDDLALWVVFEDGTETKLSFRDLSNRSIP
jgi:acetyl-CoA synthetase